MIKEKRENSDAINKIIWNFDTTVLCHKTRLNEKNVMEIDAVL